MKHTPGPWFATLYGRGWGIESQGAPERNYHIPLLIASLVPRESCSTDDYIPEEKRRANAHLMAESPAMLKALVRVEQTIRNVIAGSILSPDYKTILENELANIRAAIAKAEGET